MPRARRPARRASGRRRGRRHDCFQPPPREGDHTGEGGWSSRPTATELADRAADVPDTRDHAGASTTGDVHCTAAGTTRSTRLGSTIGSPTSSARSGQQPARSSRASSSPHATILPRIPRPARQTWTGRHCPPSRGLGGPPRVSPVRRARSPEASGAGAVVYDALRRGGHRLPAALHPDLPAHSSTGGSATRMDGLPEARAYYEQALSLPMFPAMTEGDVARVVAGAAAARCEVSCHSARSVGGVAPLTALPGASARARGDPGRDPDAEQRTRRSGSRASRRRTSQRARGRARLGRRRQRVPRLPDGARAGHPRPCAPGGRTRDRAQLRTGSRSRFRIRSRSRWPSGSLRVVPGGERVRFAKTGSDVTQRRRPAGACRHRPRARARRRLPRLARLVHRLDVAALRCTARRPGWSDGSLRRPRRARGRARAPGGDVPPWSSSPRARSSRQPDILEAMVELRPRVRRAAVFERSSPASGWRLGAHRSATACMPTSCASARRSGTACRSRRSSAGQSSWMGCRGRVLLRHPRRRDTVACRRARDARCSRERAGT